MIQQCISEAGTSGNTCYIDMNNTKIDNLSTTTTTNNNSNGNGDSTATSYNAIAANIGVDFINDSEDKYHCPTNSNTTNSNTHTVSSALSGGVKVSYLGAHAYSGVWNISAGLWLILSDLSVCTSRRVIRACINYTLYTLYNVVPVLRHKVLHLCEDEHTESSTASINSSSTNVICSPYTIPDSVVLGRSKWSLQDM